MTNATSRVFRPMPETLPCHERDSRSRPIAKRGRHGTRNHQAGPGPAAMLARHGWRRFAARRCLHASGLYRLGRRGDHRALDGLVGGHGIQSLGLSREASSATALPARSSIAWTSKYGSLTVSGYEAGTADGMNEKGPRRQHPLSGGVRLRQTRRQQAAALDQPVGAVRARQLCDGRRSGRGSPRRAFPGDRAGPAERFAGPASPVHVRSDRRLGDLRVSRRQARHPPRQAIPGDDKLAEVRRPARPQCLLAEHRRADLPARHQPGSRPLRPRLLPDQCDPERGGPPLHQGRAGRHLCQPGRGERDGRDAERQRSPRHHHPGPAEYFLDALADRGGP